MNNAQDVRMMSIKVPSDLYRQLAAWAAENISSMNAELVRSARERAERERREKVAAE